jgi:hypothetical protein
MVWAQATAEISGTARDQSGAVLPGVEITATQTDTGVTRNVITNETGSYVLPNLPIGPYRLEAGLPGFRTYVQTGIVLQVNASSVVNVVLEVGQVTEQVEVQANAAMVETRSSTVGAIIENERILELPLNGRNVTDLVVLAGAAVQQSSETSKTGGGGPMLAVAGGAGWGSDWTLDGANNSSLVSGSTLIMPFPDAMQEFKVETSGANAQKASSTAVAAVTKSGTNEFHGNLFEFVRNDLFNARSYFSTTNSTLKRNQFGGTIGGPIVRNKLFFFGGYQGTTLREDAADTRTFVPTAAILAGDWTAFTSPACNAGRQVTLRAPFVNNRIDPALYSKPALFVVTPGPGKGTKALPFPTTNDPCGEITYSGSRNAPNEGYYVGKVDYQQSDKHSLFGRSIIYTYAEPDPNPTNTNALQNTGWRTTSQVSFAFGSTYLVGPDMVHAFRLAVNRTYVPYHNVKPGELFNWCDAGVKIYCAPDSSRIYSTTITGAFSYTSGFLEGFKYAGNTYSVNDDVSLVRGNHQMAFGFSGVYGKQANYSNWASATQIKFNGGFTGVGLADFLTGRVSSMLAARPSPHHANGLQVAAYATDTWKATPKLTVNYGVRWDPNIPQKTPAIYSFDYDRFRQGIRSSVFQNAPAGFYYRGDPGFPENGTNPKWWQFAPRLGLAWDVSGDGKTSVRASYAFSYVFVPTNFREGYSGGAPWGGRVIVTNPPGGLEDPWKDIPGGNIFPYELDKNAPFPPSALFYTQDYDIRTPYSQSWNLSIQRQIGPEWLASASYVANNMFHLWANRPLNPAIFFPGVADANGNCFAQGYTFRATAGSTCSTLANTDARRRFTLERPADGGKMGYVTQADDGARQMYHGMLLSVERRVTRGVSASANYTWSHCTGSRVNLYNVMNDHPDNGYTDPNNRALDDGDCESDRRQIFNLTTVAQTPEFSNSKLRLVASGWRLSGIYRRSSGAPLFILAGSDRSLVGLEGSYPKQRPNQINGNPYGDKSGRPGTRYLNPTAFSQPDLGTVGNMGRNSIQGPGTWAFDLSLARSFNFRESQRLEFRAEAYNVTNSFRPSAPNATLNSNTFGVIRGSLEPRILQFALKYAF